MSVNDLPPPQNFSIAKGQDWPLEITVLGPEKTLKLTADAAASDTSITVEADHGVISDGDKFLFGSNVVVTADGGVSAGVRSVTVAALAGPLQRGEIGRLLRDMTGWTIEMEVLTQAGDATPAFTKSDSDINILTQTGNNRGKVQVNGLAADTSDLDVGEYVWFLWRRDSGSSRPIARGTLTVEAQGFL